MFKIKDKIFDKNAGFINEPGHYWMIKRKGSADIYPAYIHDVDNNHVFINYHWDINRKLPAKNLNKKVMRDRYSFIKMSEDAVKESLK